MMIRSGTAAWSIPKEFKTEFPNKESVLSSYSAYLNCVEINTSFYREHREQTYAKWRDQTPDNFLFSIKLLKEFTHKQRLECKEEDLKRVVNQMKKLDEKLGVIVVQLPPSLVYDKKVFKEFFSLFRSLYDGVVVLEPRHQSWSQEEVWEHMKMFRINKVIADPEVVKSTCIVDCAYYRLHGSPVIYQSEYNLSYIEKVYHNLAEYSDKIQKWCIFDNTTFGFATKNALQLKEMVNR